MAAVLGGERDSKGGDGMEAFMWARSSQGSGRGSQEAAVST